MSPVGSEWAGHNLVHDPLSPQVAGATSVSHVTCAIKYHFTAFDFRTDNVGDSLCDRTANSSAYLFYNYRTKQLPLQADWQLTLRTELNYSSSLSRI